MGEHQPIAPVILDQGDQVPFDEQKDRLVLPLCNVTQCVPPSEVTRLHRKRQPPATVQSATSTNSPSATKEKWSNLTMPSSELATQWLHHSDRRMWHLRILGGDKVVPSLRKVFFRENETVALPIHVLESAVEPYLAIQVRHLVSPKLIYQTVLYAWWLQRLKQYPCGVEYYVEMVLRPPQAVYDLVNSVENSIAIDGRLGELREEYLSNTDRCGSWFPLAWSTMTRGEAIHLQQMLEGNETYPNDHHNFLFEQMARLALEEGHENFGLKEVNLSLNIMKHAIALRTKHARTTLSSAISDPNTRFKPDDPDSLCRVTLPGRHGQFVGSVDHGPSPTPSGRPSGPVDSLPLPEFWYHIPK